MFLLLQVIVTAKFWFVSDLTGGSAMAEDQASKYHLKDHHICLMDIKMIPSNPGMWQR